MANLWDNLRPEVRTRLAPHRELIDTVARKHGLDPQAAYMLISAESSGQADAVGDGGKARGLYQVQTPYLRDYGMTADVRLDPRASTEAVLPVWSRYIREEGGDWGRATARYMRGQGSAAYKALKAGKSPEEAFGADAVGLSRYRQAKSIQARYGGAATAPQAADTNTAPAPAPKPAATSTGTSVRPATTGAGGAFNPMVPAQAPQVQPGSMGRHREQPLPDVSSVYRMFGIDKLL